VSWKISSKAFLKTLNIHCNMTFQCWMCWTQLVADFLAFLAAEINYFSHSLYLISEYLSSSCSDAPQNPSFPHSLQLKPLFSALKMEITWCYQTTATAVMSYW